MPAMFLGHSAGKEASEQIVALNAVIKGVDQALERLLAPSPFVERRWHLGRSLS